MSAAPRAVAGPVAYGALFALALPAALVAWARATEPLVRLPALRDPMVGEALLGLGVLLVLAGWASLWLYARGLPMNAYPPQRYVAQGAYRLVPHPIYVGFCLAVLGCAIGSGSASALWLVFPTCCLACAALVLGYEARDLRARFGADLPRPLLSLPPAEDAPARAQDRFAAFALVTVPWLLLYGAAGLAVPDDAVSTFLPFERRWPVVQQAELIYASTYPLTLLAIFAPRTRAGLRRLMARGLFAMALVFPLYFLLPLQAPPRPFHATTALGALLKLEQQLDTPGGALPSFHVLWALLVAEEWGARWPRLRLLARAWAAAVAVSCVLTGMHSLLDVAAGALAFWAVVRAGALWERLRAFAEEVANSWRELRIGPLRLINHGLWAGLGNLVALSVVASMVGPGHGRLIVLTATAGLVGSLLWAQLVERPPPMMRPYGFYGGVLGIIAAAALWPLFGGTGAGTWQLLAGYCCAAPFVQSLGRLRCLVQGCCHGAPAPEGVGIRYRDPRSRVCKAGLGGAPLHPTPLYSILWNGVVALVALRLWALHAPAHLLGGVYLILSGLGRFVEESYRGEPQTPLVLRLRIYQWVAVATLVAGAAVTALGRSLPLPAGRLDGASLLVAALYGLFTAAALGADFPGSQRRYARLE